MTGCESMLQDDIEWMLYAGKGFRRIVIFVVDMNIVLFYSVTDIIGQKIVINNNANQRARADKP